MEFDFHIPGIHGNVVTVIDTGFIRRLSQADQENLKTVLDVFGKRSAQAQGLGAPITDIYRLRSTDQQLYLHATRQSSGMAVLGGLKIGTKKLFVRTDDGQLRETDPTCVLDFFVHEGCQRRGIGKELFEYFLAHERLNPGQVAYDRPSPKLISFLRKHYGLVDYIPQNNNFVVFNQYWLTAPKPTSSRRQAATMSASQQPALSARPSPLARTQPALSPSHMPSSVSPTSPTQPLGAMRLDGSPSFATAPLYNPVRTSISLQPPSLPEGPMGGPGAGYPPSYGGQGSGYMGSQGSLPSHSQMPSPPLGLHRSWEGQGMGMQQQQPPPQQQQQPSPPAQPLPPVRHQVLDSLDNFRAESMHRFMGTPTSSSGAQGSPGMGYPPSASVHTPSGPGVLYTPSMVPGLRVPMPASMERPRPSLSSSSYAPRPPWGIEDVPRGVQQAGHVGGSSQTGSPVGVGQASGGAHPWGGKLGSAYSTPNGSPAVKPPVSQHNTPSASARQAALAARAGAGAAGCFVW